MRQENNSDPKKRRSLVFEAEDNAITRTPYGHILHAWRYRAFFRYWVRRGLIVRYSQTSLGILWSVLQPLLTGLIYVLVFSIILKITTNPVPYPIFIMTNLILWIYFSRVVFGGAAAITNNMDILTRVQFPREFLPLGVWVEALVDLGLGLGVLVALYVIYHFSLTRYVFLAIPVFVVHTVFALGLAFLLGAFSAIVRDLLQILPLVLQLVFYLSPIVYPVTTVPEFIRSLYLLNPLGPIFAAYQETLLFGKFTFSPELVFAAGISVLVLIVGYSLFKRMEWHFADAL